jgi:hypothetical protein
MRYFALALSIPVFAVALAMPSTSYRSSYSTFSQEDRSLSVFVDGYPASVGGNDAYVPVPVAIALMRNGASIAFTLESFTLFDAKGNGVPAAGFEELKSGYPRLDFDRALVRNRPIDVGMTIAHRPRIAANFYPSTDDGMRIARVELASYSWFRDVVYFPRPPAGLGGVMTLSVAVDAGDPIEVRFVMDPGELARR